MGARVWGRQVSNTPEDREPFLAMLRRQNVRRVRYLAEGWIEEVEFFPPATILEAAAAGGSKSLAQALSDLEATDKCKCGHTEAAHNPEGECLQGCELEVCYPGNEPPPKPPAALEG